MTDSTAHDERVPVKHLLAVAIAALCLTAAAGASPGLRLQHVGRNACGAKGRPLVNVHYTLVNDYDSGFAGNAWANDTIDRHLQIWQTSSGAYCALVEDHGSFVTFAGASPSGTSTVNAGVRGEIQGGYATTQFTGSYAPTLATRGDLGTFDLGCTSASICPGAHPSYASYFSSTTGADLATWGWIYHAGRHGTWLNADGIDAAHGGDITG